MIYFKKLKTKQDLDELLHFLIAFEKRILLVAKEAGLNILKHAKRGEVRIYQIKNGLKLVFEDFSNSLDIKKAFLKGYSTSKTLGIGLNLILNVVDEMEIIPKKDGKILGYFGKIHPDIAKKLERISDNVKTIAKYLLFAQEGIDI